MQLPPCIKLHGSNFPERKVAAFLCLHLKYAQITNSEDYLYKILSFDIVCQVPDSFYIGKMFVKSQILFIQVNSLSSLTSLLYRQISQINSNL